MSTGCGDALDLRFAGAGGSTVLTRRRYRWPLMIGRVFRGHPGCGIGSVIIQNCAGTIIPGDVVRQRVAVVDGGAAVVRGQGATVVSGVPGGETSAEETSLCVDAGSRLWFDPSPRILTAHARHRQSTRLSVEPGGQALLVDAVVLHPDLTGDRFGGYQSTTVVTTADGTLLMRDAQMLDTMPRVRDAPTAFATVHVIGHHLDTEGAWRDLETLTVVSGHRRVYLAVTDLPNRAGWAVRIAASDGGTLRATIAEVTGRITARSCS